MKLNKLLLLSFLIAIPVKAKVGDITIIDWGIEPNPLSTVVIIEKKVGVDIYGAEITVNLGLWKNRSVRFSYAKINKASHSATDFCGSLKDPKMARWSSFRSIEVDGQKVSASLDCVRTNNGNLYESYSISTPIGRKFVEGKFRRQQKVLIEFPTTGQEVSISARGFTSVWNDRKLYPL